MAPFLERNLMPRIMIRCPTTNMYVFTGIRAFNCDDYENMRRSRFSGPAVDCPHCGGKHAWRQEDTFLVGLYTCSF